MGDEWGGGEGGLVDPGSKNGEGRITRGPFQFGLNSSIVYSVLSRGDVIIALF